MKRVSDFAAIAAVAATASFIALSPATAQSMRNAQGQSYWSGDPGPVDPGTFWDSGQNRYDPQHYLSYYGSDPQDYRMVVNAPHRGAARCVLRKRIVNSNWEFHHPYIMVCN